jgi:hypothetical protein
MDMLAVDLDILTELFPFAFGVLLGITWARKGGPRDWILPWAIATVSLGAFATFATGEWRESVLYFVFDIGLVALVSVATIVGVRYWQSRHRPV